MGREVKRVPLDFNHPLNKVWSGYINPYYKECPDPLCEAGNTSDAMWLSNIVHLLLIAGEEGARGRLHPWLAELPLRPKNPPTPRMAELTAGLAGRSPGRPFGHDCLDRWEATNKIIAAAGLDRDAWAICPTCKGSGIDPETEAKYEAWERTEPPVGEGWQLWETVSEGSPISPVFQDAETLAQWMVGGALHTEEQRKKYDQALRFINVGWAPSAISDATGFHEGWEAV
jgi:hypothetical protein